MLVKKLKSGRFSLDMLYVERDAMFASLCSFLEGESVKIISIRMKDDATVMRHLFYSVLNQFTHRTNFQLTLTGNKKIQCTRSEAIALMWLLRSCNEMTLLQIKSHLHKSLQ